MALRDPAGLDRDADAARGRRARCARFGLGAGARRRGSWATRGSREDDARLSERADAAVAALRLARRRPLRHNHRTPVEREGPPCPGTTSSGATSRACSRTGRACARARSASGPGRDRVIKLSSNESPDGPFPSAIAADRGRRAAPEPLPRRLRARAAREARRAARRRRRGGRRRLRQQRAAAADRAGGAASRRRGRLRVAELRRLPDGLRRCSA